MGKMLRSPLFLMALTIFIDFTGFGLVIPLLPFWAEHLGANPLGVGLILTVYALAQFLCTPILGRLSDRYGRKRIILVSLCIEVLAFALTALANSLPLLLLARMVGGIGASNIGSAQAVVSDVTPPEKRAAGMGIIGAAIGLAEKAEEAFMVGKIAERGQLQFGQRDMIGIEIHRRDRNGCAGQVIENVAAAAGDGDQTMMGLELQRLQIHAGIFPDLIIHKPLEHKGKNPFQGTARGSERALMGSAFQEQIDHDHLPSANRP